MNLVWDTPKMALRCALSAAGAVVVLAGCAPAPPAPDQSGPPPAPHATTEPDCVAVAEARGHSEAASVPDRAASGEGRVDLARTSTDAPPIVLTGLAADGSPEILSVGPEELDDAFAAMSARQVRVVGAEFDRPVSIAATAAPVPLSNDPRATADQLWGVSALGFPQLWEQGLTAARVTVAVVDTGVDAYHPDLCGNVRAGAAFVGNTPTPAGPGSSDGNGHGTHVAGIIAATKDNGIGIVGAAPSALILPVRVLDPTGTGYTSDLARGITWAVDNGADVVNLSLGGSTVSTAVQTAVDYAAGRGVFVVAAAGNKDGAGAPDLPQYPAAGANTLAVAAIGPTFDVPGFSIRGTYVDVAAPGQSILSTVPNGYALMDGTSMATPFASATAALLLGVDPTMSPAQLTDRMTSTAIDRGTPGRDSSYGSGVLAPVAAVSPVPGA